MSRGDFGEGWKPPHHTPGSGSRTSCATMSWSNTCGKGSRMPTANDQLRQARERTESPSQPGESLSRQELAELVNAYLWEQHRERVELDYNYVGKLERGVIRWPNARY